MLFRQEAGSNTIIDCVYKLRVIILPKLSGKQILQIFEPVFDREIQTRIVSDEHQSGQNSLILNRL